MNTIKLGTYLQSKDESSEIEWLVLEEKEGKALILSKYCLECLKYHNKMDTDGSIKWESSDIRKWLNEEFCKKAFNDNEKARIVPNELEDKVFLLSKEEIEKYLVEEKDRMAKPTAHAKRGTGLHTKKGYCCWFMKDPSESFLGNATDVTTDGSFDLVGGDFVLSGGQGIRPALWVKLN